MFGGSVLVDAGALIALFNKDDANHLKCRQFFDDFSGRALTTWPALTEAVHLVASRHEISVLRLVERRRLEVMDILPGLRRIVTLMMKYSDHPMDLADASLVWSAETTGIVRIVTVDRRDFGVYRSNGQRFEIFPG